MKGSNVADAIFANTEELYSIIDALRAENQNLKTEIRLLTELIN